VFEPNGAAARGLVTRRVTDVMTSFYAEGALNGARASDAFSVRCDTSTTGPDDVDAGRMIVDVVFRPSSPIEQISVSLTLGDARSGAGVGEARSAAGGA
jgi:hypothetical protein